MQVDKVIMSDLDKGLLDYVKHLQNSYNSKGYGNKTYYYTIGRKFAHIIMEDNQKSSHSWVVIGKDSKFRVGDILKSASWNAPAKNFARGSVFGNFTHIQWVGA